MNNDLEILRELSVLAEDSDPSGGVRFVAALYSRNQLISYGFNQDKSHTFQKQWGKNPDAIFWHSETNSIFNALKRYSEDELRRMHTRLYIARSKFVDDKAKEFMWGLAAPCDGCKRCINYYQVDEVIYTMDCLDRSACGRIVYEYEI